METAAAAAPTAPAAVIVAIDGPSGTGKSSTSKAVAAQLGLSYLDTGAQFRAMTWWLLREARLPLIAAVIAGFGAVISEVGAAMMVGGNIKGETRVLTTATVLEVGRGNFDVAVALAVVLLLLTYAVNLTLTALQQRRRPG